MLYFISYQMEINLEIFQKSIIKKLIYSSIDVLINDNVAVRKK